MRIIWLVVCAGVLCGTLAAPWGAPVNRRYPAGAHRCRKVRLPYRSQPVWICADPSTGRSKRSVSRPDLLLAISESDGTDESLKEILDDKEAFSTTMLQRMYQTVNSLDRLIRWLKAWRTWEEDEASMVAIFISRRRTTSNNEWSESVSSRVHRLVAFLLMSPMFSRAVYDQNFTKSDQMLCFLHFIIKLYLAWIGFPFSFNQIVSNRSFLKLN